MDTIVSRTLSVHKEHELLAKLETAGLNDDLAQKIIESKGNALAERVVAYIQRSGYEATMTQKLAHEIMGLNFLGIGEAMRHFRISFSKRELQALAEIPFSEAVLRECQNTHILVCVPVLSILNIRDKVGHQLFFSHEGYSWYDQQKFAQGKGQVGWHLVRKTAVPDSEFKTWKKQITLLSLSEEVPSARVMVYTIIGYYLTTSKRLFENDHVRTSDVDSNGCHFGVGFGSQGLDFDDEFNDTCDERFGLASARKSM